MQHDPSCIERLGPCHLTAFLQNQLQDVADIFIWAEHVRLYDRFTNFLDHSRIRQVSGIVDQQFFSACGDHLIDDAWNRGDDVHVILAPEPFLDDDHVYQSQKSAAKHKPERNGTLRVIDECGTVQTQSCA